MYIDGLPFFYRCCLHSQLLPPDLKMCSFGVKKNKFQSIDLTCWWSTQPLHLQILTALNTSSWKDFWSKGESSHFETSPSFQISWTWSDLFRINENFIQQLSTVSPPYLLAKMAKMMSLVTKLYWGECSITWQAFPTIRMSNRPFLSSLVPLFQSESKC